MAEKRQTRYRIVVGPEALPPERHAAEELAAFLQESTGAEFRIVIAAEAGKGPAILVGPGPHLEKVAPDLDLEALGSDGLIVETREKNLILVGGRPRGTLYAVYDFLEDVLGCRWWSSEVSHIPRHDRLEVPELQVREVPILEYREAYWSHALGSDWAVRHRCNGNSTNLDEVHGGKHLYRGWVHTFYSLVSPQEHFAEHPEWYSEIDGERKWERAQLCVTNEALQIFIIEKVKTWLRESPEATIVSVSQNDWEGRCECADCMALEEREGSPSGPVLHLVNRVAEAIEREFPHVAVSTLAYQYTRKPPSPRQATPQRDHPSMQHRMCLRPTPGQRAKPHLPRRHPGLGADLPAHVCLGLCDQLQPPHLPASEPAGAGAQHPLFRRERGSRPV